MLTGCLIKFTLRLSFLTFLTKRSSTRFPQVCCPLSKRLGKFRSDPRKWKRYEWWNMKVNTICVIDCICGLCPPRDGRSGHSLRSLFRFCYFPVFFTAYFRQYLLICPRHQTSSVGWYLVIVPENNRFPPVSSNFEARIIATARGNQPLHESRPRLDSRIWSIDQSMISRIREFGPPDASRYVTHSTVYAFKLLSLRRI